LLGKYVELGSSSFDGVVKGFSSKRTTRWKDIIEKWEVALVEGLAGDILKRHGYGLVGEGLSSGDFSEAIARIKANPFLTERLIKFLETGEGSSQYPTDPTDYRNWGMPGVKTMFRDTPMAAAYLKEMEEIEKKFTAGV
jgi:hypothetical protein